MTADGKLEIGSVIRDGNECTKTVVMLHDGIALLAIHEKGVLIQYCVASGIEQDGTSVHWTYGGKYFPCFPADEHPPFKAFLEAVDAMRQEPESDVYLLQHEFRDWGRTTVHKTYAGARKRMQEEIDKHSDLQEAAEALGLLPLTAEVYDREQGMITECLEYLPFEIMAYTLEA